MAKESECPADGCGGNAGRGETKVVFWRTEEQTRSGVV